MVFKIKIIGLFGLFICGVALLIYMNLRRKTENETAVALRIMANYLQIMTATAAFDLQWPEYLKTFYNSMTQVSSSTESFISVDCFLK